jgi:hypothetical protein
VRLPVRPGDLVAGGGVQSWDAVLDEPAVVGVEELGDVEDCAVARGLGFLLGGCGV